MKKKGALRGTPACGGERKPATEKYPAPKGTGSTYTPKPTYVPAKLTTADANSTNVTGADRLPEKDVVLTLVGTSSGTVSKKIHHPIGITPLQADEWVISNSSDTPLALSRAKNPAKEICERLCRVEMYTLAVVAKVLKYVDGKVYLPSDEGGTLRQDAEAPTKFKAKDVGMIGRIDHLGFMSGNPFVEEKAYLDFIQDDVNIAKVTKKFPLAGHATRMGTSNDVDQVAIESLANLPAPTVRDIVLAHLKKF